MHIYSSAQQRENVKEEKLLFTQLRHTEAVVIEGGKQSWQTNLAAQFCDHTKRIASAEAPLNAKMHTQTTPKVATVGDASTRATHLLLVHFAFGRQPARQSVLLII